MDSECASSGNHVTFLCGFPGLAASLLSQDCPASQGGDKGVHLVTAVSVELCQHHLCPRQPCPPAWEGLAAGGCYTWFP